MQVVLLVCSLSLFVAERRRQVLCVYIGVLHSMDARPLRVLFQTDPARLPGPPSLVVQPSHVSFNVCDRTFLDGLRVRSSGANGVVYMKYGGRSDDGEEPPRRRPSTPTLRREGAGPAGRITTSVTSLGLVAGMNHTETVHGVLPGRSWGRA